jgi:putative sugar O-methyltransferase
MLGSLRKKKALFDAARMLDRSNRTVVFVTNLLRAREIKLALAARSQGWCVILIYTQTTPMDPADYFDLSLCASDDAEAIRFAHAVRPHVCHVFSGAIDELVISLCRDKPSPVVVDLNDVFSDTLFNYCEDRFVPTRECLALADGIVARDRQPAYNRRDCGAKLPRHKILFPEYCWGDTVAEKAVTETKRVGDQVHVVSVGTFCLETQGFFDTGYLRLARMLTDQGIHFHVYPHWAYQDRADPMWNADYERDFADFIQLSTETPFMHMHKSVSFDQLKRELPAYDFGLVSGGCPEFGQKLSILKSNYMEACYSGRIADYLDAGLPVLINPEVKFNYWFMKRYGFAVDLKGVLEPGFQEKLQDIVSQGEHRENALAYAKEFSLKIQGPRLVQFYSRIISEERQTRAGLGAWSLLGQRIPLIGPHIKRHSRTAQGLNVEARLLRSSVRDLRSSLVEAQGKVRSKIETVEFLESKAQKLEKLVGLTAARLGVPSKSASADSLEMTSEALLEQIEATLCDLEVQKTAVQEATARENDLQSMVTAQVERIRQLNNVLARERSLNSKLRTNMHGGEELQTANAANFAELNRLRHQSRIQAQDIGSVVGWLNWPDAASSHERAYGFIGLLDCNRIYLENQSPLSVPSICWDVLQQKHLDQLLRDGFSNFKQTINLNYFNFPVEFSDPQIESLERLLGEETVASIQDQHGLESSDSSGHDAEKGYGYFLTLLWDYVLRNDPEGHALTLKEPMLGSPNVIYHQDRPVSQDLANSLLEYYTIESHGAVSSSKRILEIGGGYGRDAYVIKSIFSSPQYWMVDIPPAVFVAQRYLSEVFPDHKIFHVQDFEFFEEVHEDIESSSFVFLLPHQLALVPDDHFDLTISISSFAEFSREQIAVYLDLIDRKTAHYFYLKQWLEGQNAFDNEIVKFDEYLLPNRWVTVLERSCEVNELFREKLLEKIW